MTNNNVIKLYIGCNLTGCYAASRSKKTLNEYGYTAIDIFGVYLPYVRASKIYMTMVTTYKGKRVMSSYTEHNAYPSVKILRKKSRLWQDKCKAFVDRHPHLLHPDKCNIMYFENRLTWDGVCEKTGIIGVSII